MTTNPKILELKDACARGDEAAIKAWVRSLQPAQVANYVKYALLHKNECPEIWQVLPFVDPNISMYGGDLLGNTASHGGLEKVDPNHFRDGLGALIHYGANPNAEFFPVEAGEGVRKSDIFSMAILSQVLKPPTYHSLDHLLEVMCRKGLTLEAGDGSLSKVEQLTRALRPSQLLEKRGFDERKRVSEQAQTENFMTRTYRGADPIEGVRGQALALYDVLFRAGADPKAPFSAPVGTRQEDLMNVVDTLWTYRHILEELQHDPQRLDALLSKDASDGWYAPEFVLDTNTLMKACVFYASLATYIQRTYLQTGFEVSDRSWAAGRAAVEMVSQSR